MRTKLSVAIALAGTLLATCLVSGSAKATSVPVLKVEGSSGIVTLIAVAVVTTAIVTMAIVTMAIVTMVIAVADAGMADAGGAMA